MALVKTVKTEREILLENALRQILAFAIFVPGTDAEKLANITKEARYFLES